MSDTAAPAPVAADATSETVHARRGYEDEAWYVASTIVVNLSNFGFHVVVSRLLGPSQYGATSALLNIVTIAGLIFGIVQATVIQEVVHRRDDPLGIVIRYLIRGAFFASIGVTLAFAAFAPLTESFLTVGSVLPVLVLALWFIPSISTLVMGGTLMGRLRFKAVAAAAIAGTIVRLVVTIVLVAALHFGIEGPIIGTVVGTAVTPLILLVVLRRDIAKRNGAKVTVSARTMVPTAIGLAGYSFMTGVDTVLARHFLSAVDAGLYAAAATAGRIALFLPSAVTTLVFPRFVADRSSPRAARRNLFLSLGIVGGVGLVAALGMAALPHLVVAVLFGRKFAKAAGLIRILALEAAVIGMMSVLVYYHLARRSRLAALPLVATIGVVGVVWGTRPTAVGLAFIMLAATSISVAAMALPALRPLVLAEVDSLEGVAGGGHAREAGAAGLVDLSLVLPAYNPGLRLREHAADVVQVLRQTGIAFEVICVSDGSTDGSDVGLEELGPEVRVVRLPENGGKGHAVHVGFSVARGTYIGFIDGDGDIPASVLGRFISCIREDLPDILVGSKRHRDSTVVYPLLRYLYSTGFQLLTRLLLGLKVKDSQSGLKIARREVIEATLAVVREDGFTFDLELLAIAHRIGFDRVVELPISIRDRFTTSISIHSVWTMFLDTVSLAWRIRMARVYDRELFAIASGRPSAVSLARIERFGLAGIVQLAEDGEPGVPTVVRVPDPARVAHLVEPASLPLAPVPLRILLCNWRDLAHPRAGGAEVWARSVAHQFTRMGHDVTWFTAHVDGVPSNEMVDGVRIIRRGSMRTVYAEARRFYEQSGRGAFDLVIDEINTRPFMAPQWARGSTKVLPVCHQLAREVWFYEVSLPIAMVGRYLLEPWWLRRYRGTRVVTISESSRGWLREVGIEDVALVPVGFEPGPPIVATKEIHPTFVYTGRLSANKRPDHAVEAFKLVREHLPHAQLWVIGTGPMQARLEESAPDGVTFFGHVDQVTKRELIARSHVQVMTSVREGWGLTVTEAAELGVPTIGYAVPGLEDSVALSGGWVVAPEVETLAAQLVRVLPGLVDGTVVRDVAPRGVLRWSEVARRLLAVAGFEGYGRSDDDEVADLIRDLDSDIPLVEALASAGREIPIELPVPGDGLDLALLGSRPDGGSTDEEGAAFGEEAADEAPGVLAAESLAHATAEALAEATAALLGGAGIELTADAELADADGGGGATSAAAGTAAAAAGPGVPSGALHRRGALGRLLTLIRPTRQTASILATNLAEWSVRLKVRRAVAGAGLVALFVMACTSNFRLVPDAFADVAIACFAAAGILAIVESHGGPRRVRMGLPAITGSAKEWRRAAALVALAMVLVSQTWFRFGTVIGGGDKVPPAGVAWLSRIFSEWTWNGSTLGSASQWIQQLPWAGVLWVVHSVGGSTALAQRLFITALFAAAALSALWLCRLLGLRPVPSAIAAGVFAISPATLTEVGVTPTRLAIMALVPLCPAIVLAVQQRRISLLTSVVMAVAISPLLGYGYSSPPDALMPVASTLAVVIYVRSLETRHARNRLYLTLVCDGFAGILASAYWIVPAVLHAQAAPTGRLAAASSWLWTEGRSTPSNALWLNTAWGWKYPASFPYAGSYAHFPLLLIRFALPAAAFAALLCRPDRRSVRPIRQMRLIGLMTLVSLFFVLIATGTRAPGNVIFDPLYRLPLGWVLREPGRFLPLAAFGYIVLIALSIGAVTNGSLPGGVAEAVRARRSRQVVGAALAGALLILPGYPLVTGQVVHSAGADQFGGHVDVPAYWGQMGKVIDSEPGNGAVLLLPTDNFYAVGYSWGYYGADTFMDELMNRKVVNPSSGADWATSSVLDQTDREVPTALFAHHWALATELLSAIRTPYILVRGDVLWDYSRTPETQPSKLESALSLDPQMRLVATRGPLELFSDTSVPGTGLVHETNYYTSETSSPDLQILRLLGSHASIVDHAPISGVPLILPVRPTQDWTLQGSTLSTKETLPPGRNYRLAAPSRADTLLSLSDASRAAPGLQVSYPPKTVQATLSLPIAGNSLAGRSLVNDGWGSVNDCAAFAPTRAGLSIQVQPGGSPYPSSVVVLKARYDEACVSQPIAKPGGVYRVSLAAYWSSGAAPFACVYAVWTQRCAVRLTFSKSSTWQLATAIVDVPQGEPTYLTLRAVGSNDLTGTDVHFAAWSVRRLSANPGSLSLVGTPSHPSHSQSLFALGASTGSGWKAAKPAQAVTVDGLVSGWLEPTGHAAPHPVYVPGVTDRHGLELSILTGLGALFLFAWGVVEHWLSRRRRRHGPAVKVYRAPLTSWPAADGAQPALSEVTT